MLIRRAGGVVLGKTVTTEFASLEPARHAQSAQSCAHAGRIVVGLGRGGGGRHAADRARQPDRRLGHPPRRLLRRRRLQAFVSAAADGRDEMLLVVARHRRPVRRGRAPTSRSPPPRSAAAICGSMDGRRAAPVVALVRTHSGMRRARRCRTPSSAPRARPNERARRVKDMELPPIFADAVRAHRIVQATRRSARSRSNTTVIAIASVRCCARNSTTAATIDADAYDDARRTTRRARQRARRSAAPTAR